MLQSKYTVCMIKKEEYNSQINKVDKKQPLNACGNRICC